MKGGIVSLPASELFSEEAEWEKAARGTDGRIYPWGNTWDDTRANTIDSGREAMTPVCYFADRQDASPYGAHDMAGNVMEWTSSIYHEHLPYRADQAENNADTTSARVLRGGSWAEKLPTVYVQTPQMGASHTGRE